MLNAGNWVYPFPEAGLAAVAAESASDAAEAPPRADAAEQAEHEAAQQLQDGAAPELAEQTADSAASSSGREASATLSCEGSQLACDVLPSAGSAEGSATISNGTPCSCHHGPCTEAHEERSGCGLLGQAGTEVPRISSESNGHSTGNSEGSDNGNGNGSALAAQVEHLQQPSLFAHCEPPADVSSSGAPKSVAPEECGSQASGQSDGHLPQAESLSQPLSAGRRPSVLKQGTGPADRSQREAVKQNRLRRPPPLLSLHLKRFEQVRPRGAESCSRRESRARSCCI